MTKNRYAILAAFAFAASAQSPVAAADSGYVLQPGQGALTSASTLKDTVLGGFEMKRPSDPRRPS